MIQASNIINDERPVGFSFPKTIVAWSTRVHNLFPGAWGGPGVNYLWVDASSPSRALNCRLSARRSPNAMARIIIRRLLLMIPLLLGVSFLSFAFIIPFLAVRS